jgi:hypothetical protein
MYKDPFLPQFSVFFHSQASLMNTGHTDARRHPRVQLPISAEVSCFLLSRFREPASLRNVSAGGAFFYAHMVPALGTVIKLDFSVQGTGAGSGIEISCEGRVVRIEPRALGEESGLAMEFSRLNLGSL